MIRRIVLFLFVGLVMVILLLLLAFFIMVILYVIFTLPKNDQDLPKKENELNS